MSLIGWLIFGAIVGGAAVAFWDEIKDWVRSISYKLRAGFRMYIEKISDTQHKIIIENESIQISASEVPEEILRKAVKNRKVDITQEAKRAGVLEI